MNAVLEQPVTPSRRAFLRGVGGAFAAVAVMPTAGVATSPSKLNIALADRAIGARGGLAAFELAKAIGTTGVEIDFGRLGNRSAMLSRLTSAEDRQHFIDAAEASNQTICSIALGAWTEQSFADHPKAVEYTINAINSAKALGVNVITLPIAHADDLAIAELRERCISNLKQLAPAAEAAGVTLAIDVALPPAEMKRLLDAVGTSAVAAAVTATSAASIAEAFNTLGSHRIAQIRFSFDQSAAQAQSFASLRDVCSNASWAGWVVIDRLAASPDDLQAVGTRAIAVLSGALTANFA